MPLFFTPQGGWSLIDFTRVEFYPGTFGAWTDGMSACVPFMIHTVDENGDVGPRAAICHMDSWERITPVPAIIEWLRRGDATGTVVVRHAGKATSNTAIERLRETQPDLQAEVVPSDHWREAFGMRHLTEAEAAGAANHQYIFNIKGMSSSFELLGDDGIKSLREADNASREQAGDDEAHRYLLELDREQDLSDSLQDRAIAIRDRYLSDGDAVKGEIFVAVDGYLSVGADGRGQSISGGGAPAATFDPTSEIVDHPRTVDGGGEAIHEVGE